MKTKQKIIFSLLLLGAGFVRLNAQEAAVSSGADATGSGGSVSYSIGQVSYRNQTASGGTITQGVQQPYEFFTVSVDEHPGIDQAITVYPNPSTDIITLNISELSTDDLNFSLYDVQGKLMIKEKINSNNTTIQMSEYDPGIYFLNVYNSKNELKTIRIIKN